MTSEKSQSLSKSEDERHMGEDTGPTATESPPSSGPPPKPPARPSAEGQGSAWTLLLLLGLVCLNYFSTNFMANVIKSTASYFVPSLKIPYWSSSNFGHLSKNVSLLPIFLSAFFGVVTDMLGAPITALLFCVGANLGLVMFIVFSSSFSPLSAYVTATVVYGGCLTFARIPLQKIASVLFAGKWVATAMNVSHTFSHISSMAATAAGPALFKAYGMPSTMVICSFFGFYSLVCATSLCGLYMKRFSLKSESAKQTSMWQTLKKGFQVNPICWLMILGAFFVDGSNVTFKNNESAYFKDGIKVNMESSALAQMIGKLALFSTPFCAMLVDKFTYRQWFLLSTTVVKLGCYIGMYCLIGSTSKSRVTLAIVFNVIVKLAQSLFYAAFYSYFGVSIEKKKRGTFLGIINSILSIAYFCMPEISQAVYGKNVEGTFAIYIICCSVGLVIIVGITVMNYMKSDILNIDRLEREAKRAKLNKVKDK